MFKVGDKVRRVGNLNNWNTKSRPLEITVKAVNNNWLVFFEVSGEWMADHFELVKEPLKLEVGKFYKTRDGRKARIDAILPKDNPRKDRNYIGFILGKTYNQYWRVNGSTCVSKGEWPSDIVDVWTDPPPKPRTGEAWGCIFQGSVFITSGKQEEHYKPFRVRWEEITDGDNNTK